MALGVLDLRFGVDGRRSGLLPRLFTFLARCRTVLRLWEHAVCVRVGDIRRRSEGGRSAFLNFPMRSCGLRQVLQGGDMDCRSIALRLMGKANALIAFFVCFYFWGGNMNGDVIDWVGAVCGTCVTWGIPRRWAGHAA